MKKKYLLFTAISLAAALITACSKDDNGNGELPMPNIDTTKKDNPSELPQNPDFAIPNKVYNDNYASYAGWENHSKWNLANTHDPTVFFYNGMYYMFGTDASYGNEHLKNTNGKHFQGKRSYDLVNWEWIPGIMNEYPQWAADSLNAIRSRMGLPQIKKADIAEGFWAPCARVVDGKVRLYYSVICDNFIGNGKAGDANYDGTWTERSFIGVMETTDPAGGPSAWTDLGYVTTSSSDKGLDYKRVNKNNWDGYFYYNAIDPTYIVCPDGKHYLIHGSWHSGFALLEINPVTGKAFNSKDLIGLGEPYADNAADLEARYGKRIATRGLSRWQAAEAPEIIYKDGYYYLFMAWDGLDVPYNTRVVRSQNIEGPYLTNRDANFTAGDEATKVFPIVTHPYKFKDGYGWVGISHCAVFQNEQTKEWFYMSQGRFPANVGGNQYSNALMMGHVRKLVWCPRSPEEPDNLWPIALPERYANVASDGYSTEITKNEIAGEYELINLGYNYGKQDEPEAENLVLNADGTMSGALKGTWTFDAAKKWLTLTSENLPNSTGSVIVCVERELDWEKGNVTLVFAGTHWKLTYTLWGKKIK
ncbi:MAG: arabinan endo-1,5-alpha-L-arabinosidase [Bacteroidales bacterium]|nr:arabinan endo-1,5-alpha-L-arabinosidase [Bacteroidales bacterium]